LNFFSLLLRLPFFWFSLLPFASALTKLGTDYYHVRSQEREIHVRRWDGPLSPTTSHSSAQQVKTDPPLAIIVFFGRKRKPKQILKKKQNTKKKTHRITSNKYSFAKRVPHRWPVSSLIYCSPLFC
jgi:hypothetical protein